MQKTFCDLCGNEIKKESPLAGSGRLNGTITMTNVGKVRVSIDVVKIKSTALIESGAVATKDVSNGTPDLCLDCIFRAVDRIDHRRKKRAA